MTKMEEATIIAKEIRSRLAELNAQVKTAACCSIKVDYQVEPAAVTKGPQVPHFELKAQITMEL